MVLQCQKNVRVQKSAGKKVIALFVGLSVKYYDRVFGKGPYYFHLLTISRNKFKERGPSEVCLLFLQDNALTLS